MAKVDQPVAGDRTRDVPIAVIYVLSAGDMNIYMDIY